MSVANCSCTAQYRIISTYCSQTNVAPTESGAGGGVWSAVIVLIPFGIIPLLTPPFPHSIHEHSSVCWHHWGSCCCHCGDWDHFLLLLLPGEQGDWLWDDVSTSPYSSEGNRWGVLLFPAASTDGVESWGEIWESMHRFLLSVSTLVDPISPHGMCPGVPDTFAALGRTKLFRPWMWISTDAMKKPQTNKQVAPTSLASPAGQNLWTSAGYSSGSA